MNKSAFNGAMAVVAGISGTVIALSPKNTEYETIVHILLFILTLLMSAYHTYVAISTSQES